MIDWRALAVSICVLNSGATAIAAERPDIVVADFEGDDYGRWRAEGEAFGPGPAHGALDGQMGVSGFLGRGLVNSFFRGDGTTGTLTSTPVAIERKYINFLIGGGHHPDETCINLLVDGKVVRTATGPLTGGGNERLDWRTWDVQDLAGRQAVLQIVDRHTGGWGHVNVDQIVLADRRLEPEPASREIEVKAAYLNLPVRTGAAMRHMRFVVDGQTVREFDIELAESDTSGEARTPHPPGTFYVASDVTPFRGQKLRIEVDALPAGSQQLAAITNDHALKTKVPPYHERLRPQFHFTSRRGWLNDPNGLVYAGGEWHLFYQNNPYGWNWGNMHWGHAVSADLLHWRELPLALYPRRYGDWCFSGSAVEDRDNTSGFQQGPRPPLVLAYTSTGRGECIAYSNDAGRTWTEYEGNPVVRHAGRDPRLLWHAPSKRWSMAVYDETDGKRWIAFYTSPDLKSWTYASRNEGFYECPDLLELPIDGQADQSRWVMYGADGKYVLGRFDGATFTPETDKQQLWHGNFYAAQTFSDAPGGRRVQIGWGQGVALPGMPFNQQMVIPVDLALRSTSAGPRMFARPVPELEALRTQRKSLADVRVGENENPLADVSAPLLDIEAEIAPGDAASCGFTVRGVTVAYDAGKKEISCGKHRAPLALQDGVIKLRLLIDRGSLEVFAGDGAVAFSQATATEKPPTKDQAGANADRPFEFFVRGGSVQIKRLVVYELSSTW